MGEIEGVFFVCFSLLAKLAAIPALERTLG